MVKHIVMFRLKEDLSAEEKQQIMTRFKRGIEALPEVISTIRKVEVGFNTNPAEKYDIALYSEFDTLEDVVAYGTNPHHVAVASELKPHVESRACCDY